jgi:hypothetical protein
MMNKILITVATLFVSAAALADTPDYMVVADEGLNCSIFQEDEYLCQVSKIGSPDAASDALVLSYQDIVSMGGKQFVPVISYQTVASK